MKGKPMNIFASFWMPLLLGLVVVIIVAAALNKNTLPLITTPRASLVAILVVGMAMCASGIGQVGASGRWTSPLAILGYLLGTIILIIFIAAFTGWKLPLIADDTQSVAAIGILIAVKFLIGTAGTFFHWL